jgi:hypothetical protein
MGPISTREVAGSAYLPEASAKKMCAEFLERISTIWHCGLIVCALPHLPGKMPSSLMWALVFCASGEVAHAQLSQCVRG